MWGGRLRSRPDGEAVHRLHSPAVDFKLTDEQRDFVSAIRDFCQRECGTQEQRERLTNNHSELHSAELYKKMADLGWLGVTIPEEYGGSAGTMLDACLFMEETARGMAPIGGYATTLIVAGATRRFGTDEQKQRILGGISEGSVEAIAMTEPESGSDVGSLSTEAVRSNGGYVLNGQKVFISNAHISDHVLVVCRTTKGENKHEGLSMIFVPTGTEGMEMKPIDTMGGRETNTIYLNDCEVPSEQLLGEQDKGWIQLMAGLNTERLILAATMLGMGQRAFDDALAYAKERKQFGRPIGSFQVLQHRFADLATDLEAARLMTHWVASLNDEDPERMLPKEASMVKLFVTETAQRVALEGMQMMGGYGYSSEYDMERLVRATLVSTIYGGTSEIQRGIIAKTLGL
jgi:alkylation response protein AidB-like acyl-CoA dehydrogenase